MGMELFRGTIPEWINSELPGSEARERQVHLPTHTVRLSHRDVTSPDIEWEAVESPAVEPRLDAETVTAQRRANEVPT